MIGRGRVDQTPPDPAPTSDQIRLALRDAAIDDALWQIDQALSRASTRHNATALVDALLDVRSTLRHGR